MLDLLGNHIVGFPTRRLKSSPGRVRTSIVWPANCMANTPKITMWQILAFIDKSILKNGEKNGIILFA